MTIAMTSEGQKIQVEGYGDMVIQRLQGLRRNLELCDFKVSADGRVFEVHKSLLAATSDYFRVMFGGMMAESQQNTVDLKGVTADGLQHVVDFIYSGEMLLTLDNLTEIINTASHLQVNFALDACSTYIKSLMTFDNAEDFLHIADTYSLDKVSAHWEHMIQDKFFEFSQSQAFLKMDGETLSRHLSQNTLRTSSEFQLLICINKWLHVSPARMASDAARLLQNIRFALMSESELSVAQEQEAVQRCPGGLGPQLTAKGFLYHAESKRGHPPVDKFCHVRATGPSLIMVHHGTSYMPFQVIAYNHAAALFYNLYSNVNGSRDCRVASVDNFAYICRIVDFGGGTLMSSLYRFDPRHLEGQELRPMRILRLEFSLVAHGGCLYAFGGSTEQFAILDSVEKYNVHSNMWEEMLPLPSPTHSLASVTHGGKIYLSGGVSGQDRQTTNSFLCFDPVADTYQVLPGMMYARRLHEIVALGEKLFVLGGIPKQGVPLYGQIPIESYCLATRQWTMLSSTLSGRSIGHYTNFEGQILALGHEHSTATEDEIWTYDPELDDWIRYAKAPQRMSLNSAMCTQLWINFNDEKICRNFMKEK